MNYFSLVLRAPLLAVILISFAGCATPTKMPFEDDSASALETDKSIYLMTATLRNTYKTEYQPKLFVVHVEKEIVKGTEDRINFTLDDKAKNESDDPKVGNNYLLRMELEAGRYKIIGLTCINSAFLLNGSFFVPLHENLEVTGPGVYYLGHINATVRKREGNEFKAGASIPLIDQSIVGASGGTFDVEIVDLWDIDEHLFRSKFHALTNVEIIKSILPPFDREKAQKWWEEH